MPKSKRNKVVHTSKVQKKDREWKDGVVEKVRTAIDQYTRVFVFEYEHFRNETFKELREELKDDAQIFMGSKKLWRVAIGRTEDDEYRQGLHQLGDYLSGFCGIVFTNLGAQGILARVWATDNEDSLRKLLAEKEAPVYARPGDVASETIEYPQGPLEQFSHDMEPSLRKEGLPCKLNKGVVELLRDYTICVEGQPLSANQSKLLRYFGHPLEHITLRLRCSWSSETGEVKELEGCEEPPDRS
eukprot:scaffold4129_cov390-Prasinococcus_capsulatus_cf.AAC.1